MAMQYGGIPLTRNQIALVDLDDYEKLSSNKWNCTHKGYASSKNGYMHRIIMNADENSQVDHINGNKLDNRKINLRLVNNSQNHANKGLLKNNTSGYKGVWYQRRNVNKWIANIWADNKKYHIGSFATKKEAAQAYDNMAIKLFGDYAKTNLGGIYGR